MLLLPRKLWLDDDLIVFVFWKTLLLTTHKRMHKQSQLLVYCHIKMCMTSLIFHNVQTAISVSAYLAHIMQSHLWIFINTKRQVLIFVFPSKLLYCQQKSLRSVMTYLKGHYLPPMLEKEQYKQVICQQGCSQRLIYDFSRLVYSSK